MEINCEAIWQYDKEEITENPSDRSILSVYTFVYENNSIMIQLPTMSPMPNLPEDRVYRLKTKWKGNDLYMFLPFGSKWELFATWENNRFVMLGNKKMKIFKKIKLEEIAVWNKDLLKPGRQIWHYPNVNPDTIE